MWSSSVTTVMVAIEFLEVGLNTVNKAAMNRGMNNFVLVMYSNIFAFFILVPSSFIFYRKRIHPPLTWSIICRIFLLSLLSCCGQMFTYIGITYSSPTMASAMTDLTPAFTFILAIIFRMEKLDLRVPSSRAKSIGTIVLITGALIITLYKGLPIASTLSTNKLLNALFLLRGSNWTTGGFFLAAHSVTLATIFIVQSWIIRDYPAEVIITFICCIFVTILSTIVSLIMVKDPNDWRLRPDMELIAIGYSAVFAVALRTVLHTWAIRKKGPVFVCMFKPLGMVIALVMGIIFLGDTLYLGSLVGAAIIALGFYSVIWGKALEEKMDADGGVHSFEASTPEVPLLQNKRSESPPLTLSLLGKFFVLGVFGSSAQIFGYAGIQYSSPTLGTAILNLIPAFTFILAIIFRLEKLDWRSTNSQAKVLGTIVSIAGAFVVTFYKGTPIIMTPSLTVPTHHLLLLLLLSPQLSWILGGFFLVGQALMDSAWFILQAFVLKEFPAVLIIMFYVCSFNTILTAIFSLIVVQDPSAWMLRLDMGLIAILYSAVVGIVFRFSLCTWCLWRTGPLYVSMFKPLAIIFAVIMDAIFLGDALCLGSLIGGIVIVSGFYAVVWGKAKEENKNKDSGVGSFKSSSEKIPLLQSKVEEI